MKVERNKKTDRKREKSQSSTSGFSMIELILVLVLILILSAMTLPYLFNYQKLYKSETQAVIIMDLMREASQLALTRRRNIRFEIDRTANQVLLIDGNGPGFADDTEIKAVEIESAAELRIDRRPSGVSRPNPPNYTDAAFVNDTTGHLRNGSPVSGNLVWQIVFQRDGTVVNIGNNPVNANLYVWTPITPGSLTAFSNKEIRAITLFGGSGAVRYWKHNGSTFIPY